MSKYTSWIMGGAVLALLALAYVIVRGETLPAAVPDAPATNASVERSDGPCGEETEADKPSARPREFKPRTLAQEKERIAKQISRAQERLAKVEAMSEKEWLGYQKQRYDRREKMRLMSPEARKDYAKKRREWKREMQEMTPEAKKAYLAKHRDEMLPLEGEE